MMAASSATGGPSSDPPAHDTPRFEAKRCAALSPGRVKA